MAVEPNMLNLRLITLKPETVRLLVTARRDHGTTLTGLLHILLLISVSRRVPAHVASSFAGETAISLLPWAAPPSEIDMDLTRILTDLNTGTKKVWDAAVVGGLRARLGQSDAASAEDLLWRLAVEWRNEIKAKVAKLPNDDVVGLLQYVSNFNEWFLQKVGKPRSGTWALSNIGTIKGNQGGSGWHIRRALFSQPAHVVGPAFNVNVVGVEKGPANAVFSWQDGVVDVAIMDGVVADLRAWLGEFEKNGTFGKLAGAD